MRIASERPRGHPSFCQSASESCCPFLHSRCYDAQHLKSGLFTAPLLRHLHGHCVVCYTVQCWLVFVVIIPVGRKRNAEISAHVLSRFISLCYFVKKTVSLTVPDLSQQISLSLKSSDVTLFQLFLQAALCGFSVISGRHCVGNIWVPGPTEYFKPGIVC